MALIEYSEDQIQNMINRVVQGVKESYYQEHPEETPKDFKIIRNQSERRSRAIAEYGYKCTVCGTTENIMLIRVNAPRYKGAQLYKWLEDNHWPSDAIVLKCYGCKSV